MAPAEMLAPEVRAEPVAEEATFPCKSVTPINLRFSSIQEGDCLVHQVLQVSLASQVTEDLEVAVMVRGAGMKATADVEGTVTNAARFRKVLKPHLYVPTAVMSTMAARHSRALADRKA